VIRKTLLAAIPFFVIAGALFAGARTEAQSTENEVAMEESQIDWDQLEVGSEVTVAGRLAVYGSEPHTYLAIAVADATTPPGTRLVQIEGDHLDELRGLQDRSVAIRGTVTRVEIGPGFPTVIDAAVFELRDD
jgi:hypothetical protein